MYRDQIINEFEKIAIDSDWWKKLPREEQLKYIKQHRKTKLRPTPLTKSEQQMTTILNSIPKRWKKTLIRSDGVGKNSEYFMLSTDTLRGKPMRDAFKDHGAVALVAFKSNTTEPEFLITRSWEENKYKAEAMTDDVGVKLDKPRDIYRTKYRPRRRGMSYDERIRDLRMKGITDRLPDRPYDIYALTVDPKRKELQQARSGEKPQLKKRSIESTVIANEVKPIYDYYSDKLQQNLEVLKDAAVPSFDSLVKKERYSRLPGEEKMKTAIDEVKNARDKLSSLSSAIDRIRSLPHEGEVLLPQFGYSRDEAKRFLEGIKDLRSRFKKEYKYAYRQKIRDAVDSLDILNQENVADAVDALKSVKLKSMAQEVIDLYKDSLKAKSAKAKKKIEDRRLDLVASIFEQRYAYDLDSEGNPIY